jgi:hypothetical protein
MQVAGCVRPSVRKIKGQAVVPYEKGPCEVTKNDEFIGLVESLILRVPVVNKKYESGSNRRVEDRGARLSR